MEQDVRHNIVFTVVLIARNNIQRALTDKPFSRLLQDAKSHAHEIRVFTNEDETLIFVVICIGDGDPPSNHSKAPYQHYTYT
jgi:hypothetical protein